jgi:tetratricopeptide (TPR) repeat protein
MKQLASLLFLLSCTFPLLHAQWQSDDLFSCGYGEKKITANPCNYMEASQNEVDQEAEAAVDKILSPLGLPHNFVLVACSEVENAEARTHKSGIRYILFNKRFMNRISGYSSDHTALSILAHEIGHHLCGHTLSGFSDFRTSHERELEADEFSGFIMYKMGASLSQAQQAVRSVARDGDDSYSTHPKLSRRLAAIKKGYDRASSQGGRPANTETDEGAEAYFEKGRRYEDNGNYEPAMRAYSTAIHMKPDFIEAYNSRARIKRNNGDLDGAMRDYNQALKVNPNDGVTYNNRGYFKYQQKDYDGALEDFTRGIQVEPDLAINYINRAGLREKRGDNEGALSDYNAAIRADPNEGWAYLNRGNFKGHQREYRSALSDYNQAVSLLQQDDIRLLSTAYNNRGSTKSSLGDKSGGCQDYKKACELGNEFGCWNYEDNCE